MPSGKGYGRINFPTEGDFDRVTPKFQGAGKVARMKSGNQPRIKANSGVVGEIRRAGIAAARDEKPASRAIRERLKPRKRVAL